MLIFLVVFLSAGITTFALAFGDEKAVTAGAERNEFSKLYSQNYPNSFAGLKLSLPIFQGGKRNQEIRQADLFDQFDPITLFQVE